MNEIYEYDCREAAEAALVRISKAVNIAVWTQGWAEFEKHMNAVQRELKTLNVILYAWKQGEAKRKAAEKRTDAEVKAEHPVAWMASVQQQQFSPIMEETTKLPNTFRRACDNCTMAKMCNNYNFDDEVEGARNCVNFEPLKKETTQEGDTNA